MTEWLLPFLCGLGASILSAWGVGGGTLLLLVMTLFLGVDQRTAQGFNLLFFLPTAATALICHARGGYLDKPTLKSAVPLAVAAALALTSALIYALVAVVIPGFFLVVPGGIEAYGRFLAALTGLPFAPAIPVVLCAALTWALLRRANADRFAAAR